MRHVTHVAEGRLSETMRSHAEIGGHETMRIYVHMSGRKVEMVELMWGYSQNPVFWLKRGISLVDSFEYY